MYSTPFTAEYPFSFLALLAIFWISCSVLSVGILMHFYQYMGCKEDADLSFKKDLAVATLASLVGPFSLVFNFLFILTFVKVYGSRDQIGFLITRRYE